MMSNCPNINHPDWKYYVDGLGSSVEAYRLFTNNGNSLPRPSKLPALANREDAETFLSSLPNIRKRDGKFYIVRGESAATESEHKAEIEESIDYVNSVYKTNIFNVAAEVIHDPKLDRDVAYHVTINNDSFEDFKNAFSTKDDPMAEELETPTVDVNKKAEWYDSREELKDFKLKTVKLLDYFEGYTLIEDSRSVIPGRIDPDSKTINVNPTLLTTEAIGHEFGQMLLYSLGGISNPVIARGADLIKNSRIEDKILEEHPDITENRLAIETLIVALNTDINKLFTQQADKNDWIGWQDALYNYAASRLGMGKERFDNISKNKLDYNWITEDKKSEEVLSEEMRSKFDRKKLTSYEKLVQDSISTLTDKKAILGKRGKDAKSQEIQKIISTINEFNDNVPAVMVEFSNFVKRETDKVYNSYLNAKAAKSRGEKGFSIERLSNWNNYVSGLDIIKEYITVVENAAVDRTNPELSAAILDKVSLKDLRDVLGKHNQIKAAYLEEGAELLAEFLTKHSSHIAARYKETFEKDYNKLPKEEKAKISKEDYINNKLVMNQSQIEKYTRDNIEAELQKAKKDITVMQRWVENLLDSDDVVVSSMVKAIADATSKSRKARLDVRDTLVDELRALEDFAKDKAGMFKSHKELYDFMLERDGSGELTGNIVSEYQSQFWIDMAMQRAKLENSKLSYDDVQKKLTEWKDENAPMTEESRANYREARNAMIEEMRDNGELSSAEYSAVQEYFHNPFGRDLVEVINEDAGEKITKWLMEMTWKYRTPSEKYQSDSWAKLVELAGGNVDTMDSFEQRQTVAANDKNDPRVSFYNTVVKLNDEIQRALPHGHKLYTRLPGVSKKGNELIREGDYKGGLVAKLKETFTTFLDDGVDRGEVSKELVDETGEPLRFIPVYYTKNLPVEERSFDVADAYLKYFQSAIDYIHKNEILPEIEMAKFLVKNREVIARNSAGKKIIDAVRNKELTNKGASLISEQFDDWLDAVVYGKKVRDQGNIAGTKIDKAKFADALGRYTALNMLGMNVVTGVSNVTVGSAMQWIEAAGGEHYGVKDYLKAKAVYSKNLPGIIGDIGSRTEKNFISVLNHHFDTLNEYPGGIIRRGSKFGQLMTSDAAFFVSHSGEHMMQSKVMVAMLHRLKAKDRDGNVLGPMLDYLSVKDGKMVVDPKVENFNETEQLAFEGKLKRVLSSLHGEYSELGRIALQKGAIGRLVYMFRKFIMTGLKRRYGKNRVSNMTGDVVEGNYITFGRFMYQLWKDVKKLELSLVKNDWNLLTDMEKSNVRKTLTELAFFTAAIILTATAFANDDDDDKEHGGMYDFLAYQAYRFKSEISFFFNPTEAMRILNSPMAASNAAKNIFKLIGQLTYPIYSGTFELDRYERGNWKDQLKLTKTLTNMMPFYKQYYRLKYVDDQLTWLRN